MQAKRREGKEEAVTGPMNQKSHYRLADEEPGPSVEGVPDPPEGPPKAFAVTVSTQVCGTGTYCVSVTVTDSWVSQSSAQGV
jgi:hypothetical protein